METLIVGSKAQIFIITRNQRGFSVSYVPKLGVAQYLHRMLICRVTSQLDDVICYPDE